ncbi:class I SAM-dependent methyltransferase [Bosea sp. 124]|uniref:class I SAM-dependent methyltransferase n=1 Tax=Bosea sp. 124 TaxID=2135642 RepID=UPI000D3B2FC8|nr:class I SAM-dependent methyltransferase [Bosea sp. 124]PTM43571.1 methyltransferase family protein [Bosea sp. 124]
MSVNVKTLVQAVVPRPIINRGKLVKSSTAIRKAKFALENASHEPKWLQISQLEDLRSEYPVSYFWDDTNIRGPETERVQPLLKKFGLQPKKLIEIGGGPGYEAWAMANAGHQVTCVDLFDELDPLAASAGVTSVIGDASNTGLPSNSFDGYWSFNSFEHLHDPDAALKEAWRLVKNGGLVHINFAPIYNSPLGLHAHYEIGVPYCQHLWNTDDLAKFVSAKDLWNLNGMSLYDYRYLWSNNSNIFKTLSLSEEKDYHGLELISRFPSCFAHKSRDLDYFTTSKLVITLRVSK